MSRHIKRDYEYTTYQENFNLNTSYLCSTQTILTIMHTHSNVSNNKNIQIQLGAPYYPDEWIFWHHLFTQAIG